MTDVKRCARCQVDRPIADYYKNTGRADGLSVYCRECSLAAEKESFLRLRRKVIEHLGGRCIRCGYDTDDRALQFDHVNGDGGLERKSGMWNRKLLKAILADTEGRYQLLCANCNTIKRFDEREIGSRIYERVVPTEKLQVKTPSERWTPERKAAMSEWSRRKWDDPEYRARKSAQSSVAMKARWAAGEVPNRPKAPG